MFRIALSLSILLSPAALAAQEAEDPFLWLEEIQGERALDQVEAWNDRTAEQLTQAPGFEQRRERAFAILTDDDQIAMPDEIQGDHVTNFWIDSDHPRGLWRISPRDAYLAGNPEWRVLIDVDALGEAEGESWVWHGADCLEPDYQRCLVSLSPGGSDADVVREFDIGTGEFVADGFTLPVAKSNVAWRDRDTLIVVTDFGPGSLTESGYGRIAKLWRRGTPLFEAETVAEAAVSDISVYPISILDGDRRWAFVNRGLTFWTNEVSLLADGATVRVPMPETASFEDVIDGRLIAKLNQPLEADGGILPIGSLVSYDLAAIAAGEIIAPELVMAPSESQAIEEVSAGGDILWVKALDDVSGRLFALRRQDDGSWESAPVALPDNATVRIAETGEDIALATVEGMLMPPSLFAVTPAGAVSEVQSLPAQFDADTMTVEQHFATSADGTRVPYFLVRPTGVEGPVPVLIHGYGGFRAAQTPTYLTQQPYRSGPLALFWVEAGNAYVLANLRGGGEYGPAWHEAALRENRQRSFDDLHAIAEDLVADGVTATGHIAISGRSNGGVLVGAAANQRPDLYSAGISGSPLTDMKRYSQLLAGASWVGEYGDPQDPEDWAFIRDYSPYQNLEDVEGYPATFYYLSTLDDRVHPGHARKMAARHEELGQTFYYREYLEGGHSVGADRPEDAMRAALLYAFLEREIGAE